MDIIFHPKKYRDRWKRCNKDDDDDQQIKLNCCCYLNCQIQSRDYFSVGKPYLRRYFDVVESYTPAVPTAEEQQHRYGVIMTEVFRVIIKIKGGGSGYLSGKIYFSTLNQHKYLYEQGKHGDMNDDDDTEDELDEYEGKGDFIRISNCKGCFGRNGRLKEHKFQGLAFSQFTHRHIFDKPQRYKVNSPDNICSVTILYAFFREAVQATVEVILKDEDSKEFGVCGLIAARNGMIKEVDYEIILFS